MMMKASISTQYGSPDLLQLLEVDKPIPKDQEVLIQVHATTVNRTDCGNLRGSPFIVRFMTGLGAPKKIIIGSDFAGEVVEIGASQSNFQVGDRVFGFQESGYGAHAQYMTIAADAAIARIPEGLSYLDAAACVEGAHYAINFINKVDLQAGDQVLVNGATGAIGSAMVQLLSYYGAEITATCQAQQSDLVLSLGAKRTIDYNSVDFTQDKERFDFVFDSVGKSHFSACKPLLKPRGIYISSELGPGNENVYLPLVTKFFSRQKTKFPFPVNAKGSVLLVKKLIEEGKFKPLIDRQFPLEQISQAFHYVEAGQKLGNVAISIDHQTGEN